MADQAFVDELKDRELAAKLQAAPIKLQPVTSSNIMGAGHDGDLNMLVLFKTGGAYLYPGVKPEVFAEFMASQSKGAFFMKNIRSRYEPLKIVFNPDTIHGIIESLKPETLHIEAIVTQKKD